MKKTIFAIGVTVWALLQAATYNVYIHPFDTATVQSATWIGSTGDSTISNTVTSLSAVRTLSVAASSTFNFRTTPQTGYQGPVFKVVKFENGVGVSTNDCVTTWNGTVDAPAVHIYEAKAEPRRFQVNFIAYNGEATESKEVVYASTYGTLPTPKRGGYTFKGWWTASSGGTQITAATKVTILAVQNLHAHWTPNTYTVTLSGQGATTAGTTSVTATYQAALPTITPPTRTGYRFGGYYSDADATGTLYYNQSGSSAHTWDLTAATTLYAKWTPVPYAVTFDGNGGTPAMASRTVTMGGRYEMPTEPTRTGYTFAGWWTTSTAGTQITAESVNGTAAAQKFYAHWTPKTYMVTFSANDKAFSPTTSTVRETFGKPYQLPVQPSYTGYTFAGWWTTTTGGVQVTGETLVSTASDHDLFAHWTTNAYSIAFNPGPGSVKGSMADVVLLYDTTGTLPTCAFSKNGYEFDGWTNATGTAYADQATVSNLTAVADATVTLFARWNPKTYNLLLDAGTEGTFTNGLSTITVQVTVDTPYDLPVVVNTNPQKPFSNWTYKRYGAETILTSERVLPPASGATNLVASWESDAPDLSKALDDEARTFDVSHIKVTTNWFRLADATAVNGSCAAATIDPEEVRTNGSVKAVVLMTKVVGSGRISFDCRIQSPVEAFPDGELPADTTPFDNVSETLRFGRVGDGDPITVGSDFVFGLAATSDRWVSVTGWNDPAAIVDGTLGWTNFVLQITAEPNETNTLYWMSRYGYGSATANLSSVGTARVDNVVWMPASSTNEVHNHSWTYKTDLEAGTITAVCTAQDGSDNCAYRNPRPVVTLYATNVVYTGAPVTVQAVATDWPEELGDWNNVSLYELDAAEPLSAAPSAMGIYTAVLTTSGGAVVCKDFSILPCDLSDATVVLSAESFDYNGQERSVTVTSVSAGGRTLTRGTDYEVSGELSALNVGTYAVRITGKGSYAGACEKTWAIAKSDAQTAAESSFASIGRVDMVDGVLTVSVTNDVAPLTLSGDLGEITLDLNGHTLRGVDGTVAKPNGQSAVIVQASTGSDPTVLSLVGTGAVIGGVGYAGATPGTGAPAITYGADTSAGTVADTVEVVDGVDGLAWSAVAPTPIAGLVYTGTSRAGVQGGSNVVLSGESTATAAGVYVVRATPQTGFAWRDGSTNVVEISWTIAKGDLSKAVLTLSATEKTYSGQAQTVSVTSVKLGGKVVAAADYAVLGYLTATEVGAYTVSAQGRGNYEGEASAVWSIKQNGGQAAAQQAFAGIAEVTLQADGTVTVALTSDVTAPLEIPDNLGAITLDLQGHSLIGATGAEGQNGSPAIRIVAASGTGSGATVLTVVNSGAAAQLVGGDGGRDGAGAPAIENASTRPGVKWTVLAGSTISVTDGADGGVEPSLAYDDNAGVAVNTTVKNVYVGWLVDGAGIVRATATYTLAKANKRTGIVKATAKIFNVATKKSTSVKGEGQAGEDGTLTVELFKARTSYGTVTFQGDSVVSAEGAVALDGQSLTAVGGRQADRKLDAAKYATVASLAGAWTAYLGEGAEGAVVSLKVATTGKATIKAYFADGTMVSGRSQLVLGKEGWAAVPIALAKSVRGVMKTLVCVYWIGLDGTVQGTGAMIPFQAGGMCGLSAAEVSSAVSRMVVTDLVDGTAVTDLVKPKLKLTTTTGLVSGSFRVSFVNASGRASTKNVKVYAVALGDEVVGFGVCKGVNAMSVDVPVR